MNKIFTWVQTHKQLVEYLSGKEGEQKELIKLLKESGATMFNDRDESGNIVDLEEIDPFTFFCYIHKYGDERRFEIFQNLGNQLGLPIPSDFSGIPSANAQSVWLFPYKKDRIGTEIDRLWSFFYGALNQTITDEQFEDTINIKNVAKTKLTEGLFYILPENYFPVNSPAKPYLKEVFGINPNFKTWTEYLNILEQIREKTDKPFYEISHEAWLWNDERKRKEAELSGWLELVEQYKAHLRETSHLGELYKWEAVKHFQDTLDLNSVDFQNNFKRALSKSGNLLYQNSKGFINKAVVYYPDEVSEMFKDLYDEDVPIQERVQQFVSRAEELEPKVSDKHGKPLNHQQDERTLSFYLTMKYPDRYPLYKDEIYQYLVSQLPSENPKSAGEKFFHYLEIAEKLIPAIETDEELFELATQNLNENCYNGEQKWLVFQDILWVNKRQIESDSDTNYWLFQGNPSLFDVEQALKDKVLTSWRVNAHKEKIKPGDKVIIWASGDRRGCYALCEVESNVREDIVNEDEVPYYKEELKDEPFDQVELRVTHNLSERPITYEQIKEIEDLKDLKIGNQGTNFAATKEEYETLIEIAEKSRIDLKWKRLQTTVRKINNETAVRKFFSSVRFLVNKLGMHEDHPNLYAAAVDFYLHLTVGGKYLTFIQFKNKKIELAFHVDRSKLEELLVKYPGLEARDGFKDDLSDTIFAILDPDDVEIEDFLDASYLVGKALDKKFAKSSYRSIYPNVHNPWIVRVANSDVLLEKLLKGKGPGVMVEETKKVPILYPLNTIFYGPPGTGKTYNTIKRAAEIVEGRIIQDYDEAKQVFNSRIEDNIEFITFHQNYSYEDFIQGLRPDIENGNDLTFNRVDGIFKDICDRALKNLKESDRLITKKKSFDTVFNDFISPLIEGDVDELEVERKRVSYFITNVNERSIEFRKASGTSNHTLSIRTLNKMYDSESLLNIQGLSGYYSPLLDQLLEMGRTPGVTEIVERKNYVLIIDEINRANISRVFGELITLIEPDKRYGRELHIPAKLPSGENFSVPENLYIIGTMNTADKSIALLDIALRRRFEFEAMYPKYEIHGEEVHDADVLRKINERIIKLKGHDFQIGHSYFMKNHISLEQRMNRRVIPLLLEYFMNNEKEVKEILSHAGLKIKDGEHVWPLEITGRA